MLKTYLPQSKILQNYIEVFYTFKEEKPLNFSYLAFPHVNSGLSFFKGVNIDRSNYQINISGKENNKNEIKIEILGKYTIPLLLNYSGKFEEISIVFKPLGINRFLKNNLINYTPNYSQELSVESWNKFSIELFKSDNPIDQLEEFLLSQLHQNTELDLIAESLSLIESTENEFQISEIAEQLNMNIKTFQRQFKKHVTCTASEYKRISKFRNAIQSKLLSKDFKSLTSISHENNFFDQSYFIKEFKKLSSSNPKEFFKKVSSMDNKIFWEIH